MQHCNTMSRLYNCAINIWIENDWSENDEMWISSEFASYIEIDSCLFKWRQRRNLYKQNNKSR